MNYSDYSYEATMAEVAPEIVEPEWEPDYGDESETDPYYVW